MIAKRHSRSEKNSRYDVQLDGILNINKSSGITSMDVIRRVKRASGQKRVGHGGTLDPLASGMLETDLRTICQQGLCNTESTGSLPVPSSACSRSDYWQCLSIFCASGGPVHVASVLPQTCPLSKITSY